jgi:hypothetical protein
MAENRSGPAAEIIGSLPVFLLLTLLTLCTLTIAPMAGTPSAVISVPIGDMVPLNGTAAGTETVYLFLTGPNLPVNGVRLDDIGSAVITGDPSSFTRVHVINGRWIYVWNTHTAAGVPDAGTYTVWVVDRPSGRLDLQNSEYSEITVILTSFVSVTGSGILQIDSTPEGAAATLNDEPVGVTPVLVRGLPPGEYLIVLIKEGYLPASRNVTLEEGEQVNLTLTLQNASVFTPPETTLSPGFSETTVSPPTTRTPLSICATIVVVLILIYEKRRSG